MFRIRRIFLAILAVVSVATADEVKADLTLETPRGTLKGFHTDLGNNMTELFHGSADIFLGIPYVLPPTETRRFKKPEAMCRYSADDGVYDATAYKPACPQMDICGDAGQSEDCLTLNVFSPDVKSKQKYPVMVYVHGGALMEGCAQVYEYKGAVSNLVSRGVVVVVMQYRLNMLGFFTTLTDEFPANLGMLDQVEALKWVNDQIEYFGGDPYRITLFGQSAGSVSVCSHTYSPLSQDLFQQVIMQSGVTLTLFEGSLGYDNISYNRAHKLCNITEDAWNAGDFTGLADCLAAKTPEDMYKLDNTNIVGWKVQVDGNFMPDIPHHLAPFRPNMPTLLGNMRDEWTYYDMSLMKDNITKYSEYSRQLYNVYFDALATYLGDRMEDMRNILQETYAGVYVKDLDHQLWMRSISASFTSAGFTSFIIRDFQDNLANNNSQVYLYEMTYGNAVGRPYDLPGWPDAVFHTAELGYVWSMKDRFDAARDKGTLTDEDFALADWFGRTWTDFAKHGKPTLDDSWLPLPVEGTTVYLDISGSHPTMKSNYRTTDDTIWNHVLPALEGDFFPAQNGDAISIDDFNRVKSMGNAEIACNNIGSSSSFWTDPWTNSTSSAATTSTTGSTISTTSETTVETTTKSALVDSHLTLLPICLLFLKFR